MTQRLQERRIVLGLAAVLGLATVVELAACHLLPSGADRARRAADAAFADEEDVPGMSQRRETGP